jgi:hypothetical protein
MQALAASCEELRARTGNPPLSPDQTRTQVIGSKVVLTCPELRWGPIKRYASYRNNLQYLACVRVIL